jgi:hypothetical protein
MTHGSHGEEIRWVPILHPHLVIQFEQRKGRSRRGGADGLRPCFKQSEEARAVGNGARQWHQSGGGIISDSGEATERHFREGLADGGARFGGRGPDAAR